MCVFLFGFNFQGKKKGGRCSGATEGQPGEGGRRGAVTSGGVRLGGTNSWGNFVIALRLSEERFRMFILYPLFFVSIIEHERGLLLVFIACIPCFLTYVKRHVKRKGKASPKTQTYVSLLLPRSAGLAVPLPLFSPPNTRFPTRRE